MYGPVPLTTFPDCPGNAACRQPNSSDDGGYPPGVGVHGLDIPGPYGWSPRIILNAKRALATVSLFALPSSLGIRNNVYPDAGFNHETNHVIPAKVCGVDFAHL